MSDRQWGWNRKDNDWRRGGPDDQDHRGPGDRGHDDHDGHGC